MDGFGTTCYVKLHRGERRLMHDWAVESREVERWPRNAAKLRLGDRIRLLLRTLPVH